MSPERITDLRQISDKVLVDLKTWLEPWLTAVRGGDGGGITEITSDDGSVTITNPTGPVVDLSAPGGGGGGGALIAGSVYNDGSIRLPASSPGFSVVLVTGGGLGVPAEFTVTFDVALSVEPVVELTPNNNNGPAGNDGTYQASIKDGSTSVNGFSVLTTAFDVGALADDGGWDFACFAPGVGGSSGGGGREIAFNNDGVSVAGSAGAAIPFEHQADDALLDYSTADVPTFVGDGVYAITANVNASGMTAGALAQVTLDVGGEGATSIDQNAATGAGFWNASVYMTWRVTAGDGFQVGVFNLGAATALFSATAYVQKIG